MIDLWPIAVLGILYLWRVDFQSYSVFTVGTFKKVYRYESTDQTAECSENLCESGCLEGEIRKATKEVVIFGCPVIRQTTAVNSYCPDHTSFEFEQGEYSVTTTERVKESVLSAIISLGTLKFEPQSESELTKSQKTASNDVAAAMGDAFSLLPVLVLVLCAAMCISLLKGIGGRP